MKNILQQNISDTLWLKKSIVLGISFFLAILLVKPIGVSTQFSVMSGIFHSALDESVITENKDRESGYESTNAYYDKNEGKLAKSIQNPWNYDFVFVLSIPLGAYIASKTKRKKERNKDESENQSQCQLNSSKDPGFLKKYLTSFLGGMILLYGARMAGGCTSGHMMSGIMQGSISGYLFAISVFLVAIPTAIIIKKKGGK